MITEILVKAALAQEPLVPKCPGGVTKCGEEQLLQLGINVIDFMIKFLAFPLVVLFFLIGGFLLLTSGGSPNRIEQGKRAITGAVVGLVIVLTSVVVIHTFFTFFVDKDVCESKLGTAAEGGLWSVECKGAVEQVK